MKLARYNHFDEASQTILNGQEAKDAYILVVDSDVVPSDYTDISLDLLAWNEHGVKLTTDFLQMREYLRGNLNLKTWANCTSDERDLLIELFTKETSISDEQDNTNKVTHLVTVYGMSVQEATIHIIKSYATFHIKEVEACKARAHNARLYEVIGTYLNLTDAADLGRVSENLLSRYSDKGIRGMVDTPVSGEGLMDFIESTPGTSYEFAGLAAQGYSMQTGTLQDLIDALVDIFRNGNYY